MAIDKNTGEVITLKVAVNYTYSFQNENPNAIKSFFVGKEKLDRILEQEDCIGIRIYNGNDTETNKENRVLVGVDKDGEDISGGVIVEELSPCPSHCPKSSPLIKP
ncbi:hypothetical protein [Flavobacterium sp.]|uniref:hypothetical protein n=1 Tax=Flavobacterium sp. TaxID=239 RepID=UPI0025BDFB11|nr:hypothetical protein [Flavobacterium sp.]MBA4153723.1 hypothetical protein [Flavobacterium sp.]MDP2160378.1 hypothetical protein [Flavobacterium sp.]